MSLVIPFTLKSTSSTINIVLPDLWLVSSSYIFSHPFTFNLMSLYLNYVSCSQKTVESCFFIQSFYRSVQRFTFNVIIDIFGIESNIFLLLLVPSVHLSPFSFSWLRLGYFRISFYLLFGSLSVTLGCYLGGCFTVLDLCHWPPWGGIGPLMCKGLPIPTPMPPCLAFVLLLCILLRCVLTPTMHHYFCFKQLIVIWRNFNREGGSLNIYSHSYYFQCPLFLSVNPDFYLVSFSFCLKDSFVISYCIGLLVIQLFYVQFFFHLHF